MVHFSNATRVPFQVLATTPQEHIQEKVIEIAKERVTGTEDTVSQIAYSLGFQYPQHFCRLFKKRVGCTPNEYRLQNNM